MSLLPSSSSGVRQAELSDVAALVEMQLSLLKLEPGGLSLADNAVDLLEKMIAEAVEFPGTFYEDTLKGCETFHVCGYLVAWAGEPDNVVGCIRVDIQPADAPFVGVIATGSGLYVQPAHRRGRIAKALIGKALEVARMDAYGVTDYRLIASHEHNVPLKAYERLGFRPLHTAMGAAAGR